MIDPLQQRQDCSCAECRVKQYALLRRGERRTPRTTLRRRALPVRHPQGVESVCPPAISSCRKPPAGFPVPAAAVSKAISNVALRNSPMLNFYPTDSSPDVHNAMQFFFEVFTMSIHPHVDIPDGWKPREFWATNMPYAIADPMWFHGTMAFAESMKQKAIFGTSRKSKEVMKYSSKAIAGLRERIAGDKSSVDDLAILTIMSLMSTDVIFREVTSWKAHIEGLDRILALRGGLDSLNASSEYVKHKIIGYQLFWLYKQMSLGTAPEFAVYPEHPFPPDLCLPISKMPDGLAELALEGLLNTNLIKLMAPVLSLASKFAAEGQKEIEDLRRLRCLAYELEELFTISDMTQIELLVTMALIDFCITLDGQRRQHWLLVATCQVNCTRILFTGFEYDSTRHDLLVWLGSLFVACGEPTLQSARLGQKILSRCGKEQHTDRQTILATCHQFAWDGTLEEKLDSRFDFDAASSVSSGSSTQSPEEIPKHWNMSPELVTQTM